MKDDKKIYAIYIIVYVAMLVINVLIFSLNTLNEQPIFMACGFYLTYVLVTCTPMLYEIIGELLNEFRR